MTGLDKSMSNGLGDKLSTNSGIISDTRKAQDIINNESIANPQSQSMDVNSVDNSMFGNKNNMQNSMQNGIKSNGLNSNINDNQFGLGNINIFNPSGAQSGYKIMNGSNLI